MNIKSIELEHTNPSLGPHEKITLVVLLLSKDNIDNVNTFLRNCIVNTTVSLFDYLQAEKSKNKEVIDAVLKNAPKELLKVGEGMSHLSFHFNDGQIIQLNDVYRQFQLSNFYPDFTTYMMENGMVLKDPSSPH